MSEKQISMQELLEGVDPRDKAEREKMERKGAHSKTRFRNEYVDISYTKQDGTPLTDEEFWEMMNHNSKVRDLRILNGEFSREAMKTMHLRAMTDKIREVAQQMKSSTLGSMFMILGEVKWSDDNVLVNEQGRPMMVKDFQALLGGKSRSVVMNILADLKEVGFLTTEGEKAGVRYIVNPEFHNMGGMGDNKGNFVRLYTEAIKQLTKEIRLIDGKPCRISPGALGFFYKLMPYIHMDTNSIVHNPEDPSRENARLALETELHTITGVDRKTVKKYMRELNHFGVLATLEIYGKKSIIPNPKYLYRGNNAAAYKAIKSGFQEIMDGMERRDRE